MKAKTLLGGSMVLLALLGQAGCTRDGVPGADAATQGGTATAKGGGFRGSGAVRPVERSIVLPTGTLLVVRTTNTLSTKNQQAGQSFAANLEQPLILNGREYAAKGADVEGRIVDSDEGGRVKGVATLTVQLTKLRLANGREIDISTRSIARSANSTKKKDAAKIGIGSGIGAAIGAIAGGGKGAAIGAAAGAGGGTGVVLATHGDAAVIPSESVLHFTLNAPSDIA